MKKVTDFIVEKRNIIIIMFIILTIISVFLSKNVRINSDMTEYLPSNSETRIGMDIMDKEFEEEKESYLNVMFKNLKEEEKEQMQKELSSVEGVSKVEYEKENEKYNSKEYTLYIIKVEDKADSKTAASVYKNIEDMKEEYEIYTSGSIEMKNKAILPEWILILVVIICAVILIIMCESYIEPFLFLTCIGIAVLLNNGSNIIFGTVSNITSSISAVLQLALSMDYSIMLINRYKQEKEKNSNKVEAMKEALYKSFSAISSSSLTTIVGLLTLVFMSFTIGRDLGFVLAKGVILSLLSIFTCLPALILMFDKIIVRTQKRTLDIKINKIGDIAYKFRALGFLVLVVLFVGSYMLKGNLGILYTASDESKVADIFPENNQLAIIYNNKDEAKVSQYLNELENKDKVDEVLAYGNTIGEKLKYDEFNNKLDELETDTQIDEYLLKILYYNYYNSDENRKMTFDEFVDFTEKDVLKNENFSSKIDDDVENNIQRLKKFTSKSEMDKKRTYNEIANILEMDKKDSYNLFVYYYSDKNNINLTIEEFVNFINKVVLKDKDYSSNISSSAKKDLESLSKFLNKNTITKSMNSKEMANLFGLDQNTVDALYLYYYSMNGVDNKLSINEFSNFVLNKVLKDSKYKNKFDTATIDNLKLLQTMSNKNIIDKNMNSSELSKTFGIDENRVKQLLLLKYMEKDNGTAISLKEFVNFVEYLEKNTKYLDNVDVSSLSKISVFVKNENNINTTKMNKIQLAYIFDNVSKGLVDKVYVGANLPNEYQMSPQEFINFVITNLSGSLDNNSLGNLKLIKFIIDDSTKPKKYKSTEVSKALNISTKQTNQIYGLYDYTKGNTSKWVQTPYQFVKYILDNKDNKQIAGNINKQSLEQLQSAYKIMSSSKKNQKYSYNELSKVIGVDSTLTKSIYALYASQNTELKLLPQNFVNFILKHKEDEQLKGKINAKTSDKLKLVSTVMKSTIDNKKYSSSEIADLLGLNKEDVKLLYSLYSAKNGKYNMSASLKEFVQFILKDVVTNNKYSDKFDNEKITKLNTINGIMNAVVNHTTYNPSEIFTIISRLTNSIDINTVEVLYIYYGSEKYYQDDWSITIEEFINYINDKILEDSRFNDFIEDDMRNEITDAKNTIQDNKEKLVGKNYSRVVINSKLEAENEETYNFIQNIYDNLDGAEFYIIGDSPMSYEMSKTFGSEFDFISILTMIAIFVVVAITFKSLTTPFILVLLIQCAVYVTMGILGVVGGSVYFIAILVVQSILMGATIDYAIVYTSYYIESRGTLTIKDSIKNAYNKSIHTILTSSSILIIATFLVGRYASGIVSMLCKTLAEGVSCSTILILVILPETIAFLDKFVLRKHTSVSINF